MRTIEVPLTVLAELQRKGLVRHIGLSNVTPTQIMEGRKSAHLVFIQNQYNLVHRGDDALIDDLARDGIAYVPFFPLGGFTPLQSSTLSDVAQRLGATPMQVALACAQHPSGRRGASSAAHAPPPLRRQSATGSEIDETTIDRHAMGRLAKALAFICGADHPTTVALKAAAESGAERDIKKARALFLKLKQSDRRAALAMLEG
jgi:hypothetical protein